MRSEMKGFSFGAAFKAEITVRMNSSGRGVCVSICCNACGCVRNAGCIILQQNITETRA